eukprot:CAMPEP_0197628150 /NCGR_PEP_ID=MMETSP1338-20131121/6559_1 /TAXON_ID=43686 ORGANISM="Pelagodinium beii, Strain RCC1491" /NCGR_SAMPLE_ID=MMETSP1338 /ASSEMBLY_ACC=CAM_ASM_000754 /LENGTH=292 /DNA_ID=CAMNT_0043199069 /DNA_START=205 /DNA_END=1084 /DNA_ORIENTATION=-
MGQLNPNYAVSGAETYKMPSSPMLESSITKDVSGQGGSVGVLFNGAYLFSPFAGKVALTGYSSSATALEGDTFEKCGCHSSSSSSAGYHCHIPPSCLLAQLGETTTDHSPQVGWAPDGFPVYGPRGPSGALIKLCSESTNSDTTYCLDECSGLEMELPEVDDFKYRYYITGEDWLDGSNSKPLDGSDPINPLSTEPFTLSHRSATEAAAQVAPPALGLVQIPPAAQVQQRPAQPPAMPQQQSGPVVSQSMTALPCLRARQVQVQVQVQLLLLQLQLLVQEGLRHLRRCRRRS